MIQCLKLCIPSGQQDDKDDQDDQDNGNDDADQEGRVVRIGLDGLGPIGFGELVSGGVSSDLEPVCGARLEGAIAVVSALLAILGANGKVLH